MRALGPVTLRYLRTVIRGLKCCDYYAVLGSDRGLAAVSQAVSVLHIAVAFALVPDLGSIRSLN
jgi:hypothetical protein